MPDRILIINADDLGYDPAVTRGILESMRGGVVSSTTLIVNSPHSERAAASAKGLAIGLHLNLARFAPVGGGFPAGHLVSGELSQSLAGQMPADVVGQEAPGPMGRPEGGIAPPATHAAPAKPPHPFPAACPRRCPPAT